MMGNGTEQRVQREKRETSTGPLNGMARAFLHPGAFMTLRNWVYHLRHFGGVDLRHVPLAAAVTILNLLYLPLRLLESLTWSRRIRKTEIRKPPIFILGHWRSGTTLLHNLMAQDRSLTFVTSLQAFAPCGAVGGSALMPVLAKFLKPQKRATDDVVVGLDDPQEEEFAVAAFSPCALYSGTLFPTRFRQIFRQTVLFDPPDGGFKEDWKKSYLHVLKVATLVGGGRRLVLKNPSNTARVAALLELFPDAKFIHIARNPLETYISSARLLCLLVEGFALQPWSREELEEMVLEFYGVIMRAYLRDRNMIPAGNLVEVRYEDLVSDPVRELERIYGDLGLDGFDEAKPGVERFADRQTSFRAATYAYDGALLDRLLPRLRFAFEELGYDLPGEAGGAVPVAVGRPDGR